MYFQALLKNKEREKGERDREGEREREGVAQKGYHLFIVFPTFLFSHHSMFTRLIRRSSTGLSAKEKMLECVNLWGKWWKSTMKWQTSIASKCT